MGKNLDVKTRARLKRKRRIRKRVMGTPQRPRLSVFRSAKHIYAQVIDDVAGKTIAAASSLEKAIKEHSAPPQDKENALTGKVAVSDAVGNLIAQRLMEKGIKKVVFDRNGFLYHGRVRAVAESARKAGLDF